MAGRYTGSYLDRSNGWRAVATLAEIGRALLVGRIPKELVRTLSGRLQQDSGLIRVKIFSGRPRGTFMQMRYSLRETDRHEVIATTVATDRDEAPGLAKNFA
jgi:hypothetical protein